MIDYIRITPEGHIRVTDAAPFDYIVSYMPFPDINKMVGDLIALPNAATVTRKSGKVETLIVNWEPVSTDIAGTFDISGSVGNGAGVVVQRVIVAQLTDLDILRQIRDANPTSQLPALWRDDEDPYTQWEGVIWASSRVTILGVPRKGIQTLHKVNKLTALQSLDCYDNQLTTLDATGLTALQSLDCGTNMLTTFNVQDIIELKSLYCPYNQLTSIPSLVSKGLIVEADFTHNLMQPAETDRLINAVGFAPYQVLPQDI